MSSLKPKPKLSNYHLNIFILIFALIGGVVLLITHAASNPNLPGDLNNDNTVNAQDLSLLLSNYGTTNPAGDVNSDGTVNAIDLSILLSHYGQSVTVIAGGVTPNSLPAATVGSNYSQTFGFNGSNGPYSFRVTQGSLPTGLSLNSPTLSGTPSQSGTFSFTVSAFDKNNVYVSFTDYNLTVNGTGGNPSGYYVIQNFENTLSTDITSSPWHLSAAGQGDAAYETTHFKPISGYSGQGVGLVTTPNDGSSSACCNQLTSVYADNGEPLMHTGKGESTWYRVRVKFPSGAFFPTTGEWNWVFEWHNDSITSATGSVSMGLGVSTDFPVVSGQVGNNPRLFWRPQGGNASSPTSESWYANSLLQYDHWYDIMIHVVWDTAASNAGGTGSLEVFVDGQQFAAHNSSGIAWSNPHPFPTLSFTPTHVDLPGMGIYNYHLYYPTGNSEVDFDDLIVGPTRTSIGG